MTYGSDCSFTIVHKRTISCFSLCTFATDLDDAAHLISSEAVSS